VIPPDTSAAFVADMEDALEVYQRPHDPQRPLVCLDETSKQLIIETRAPIPAKPGQPARHDYEYERNGVANLFMVFAPLEGWRHVKVTDRHTALMVRKGLVTLPLPPSPAFQSTYQSGPLCGIRSKEPRSGISLLATITAGIATRPRRNKRLLAF
jgi:hypothetical protein